MDEVIVLEWVIPEKTKENIEDLEGGQKIHWMFSVVQNQPFG